MVFIAALACPRCGHRFRAAWRSRTPPAARDLFEVVCPGNGSSFRFHAVAPPPEYRGPGAVVAESVEAVVEAVRRVAPAPRQRSDGEEPGA